MDVLCVNKAAALVDATALAAPRTAVKSSSPAVPKAKVSVKLEREKVNAEKAYQKFAYNARIAPASIRDSLAKAKSTDPVVYKELRDQLASFNPKSESWKDFQIQIDKKRKASQGTGGLRRQHCSNLDKPQSTLSDGEYRHVYLFLFLANGR